MAKEQLTVLSFSKCAYVAAEGILFFTPLGWKATALLMLIEYDIKTAPRRQAAFDKIARPIIADIKGVDLTPILAAERYFEQATVDQMCAVAGDIKDALITQASVAIHSDLRMCEPWEMPSSANPGIPLDIPRKWRPFAHLAQEYAIAAIEQECALIEASLVGLVTRPTKAYTLSTISAHLARRDWRHVKLFLIRDVFSEISYLWDEERENFYTLAKNMPYCIHLWKERVQLGLVLPAVGPREWITINRNVRYSSVGH